MEQTIFILKEKSLKFLEIGELDFPSQSYWFQKYLERINFSENISIDLRTLKKLHKCHVCSVPFENIDIQNQVPITLSIESLYKKVVLNHRGGFCYELNYLFYGLLRAIGFDTHLISAEIYEGKILGPEFDHMVVLVWMEDKPWLVDVGFGSLFVLPMDINDSSVQFDGRNFFRIESLDANHFCLYMSYDSLHFTRKYRFSLTSRNIEEYGEACYFKQHSSSSFFVKNKIVTMPIDNGRKTLLNDRYITRKSNDKKIIKIENARQETEILEKEFGIRN